MQLNDEPERLFIRSSPRLQWLLGVLVAAVGGLVLLAAVGVLGDGKTYTIASRTGAGLLGGLVCAIGTWIGWRAPLFTLVVDRVGRTVTLTRRRLFHTMTERYPADAIVDARVTKERDGKGTPLYRVELVLHTGNVVPLPLLHRRDREGCMRAAEHLWTALDLPRA